MFSALSELEFDSFRSRLERELEAYTEIKAGKRRAKKSDVNGGTDAADAAAGSAGVNVARDGDEDVEMVDNPAKRVKREGEGEGVVRGDGDGDETQEEEEDEVEEEEEEEQEDDEEEDDDEDGDRQPVEDDIDRVEDLDSAPRPRDPDAEGDETDDDDGPGNQLRDNMGLG